MRRFFAPLPGFKRLLAALLAALLAGCSPLVLINGLVPQDTYTLQSGIAYGGDPRQQLDIYIPAKLTPGVKAPVVVFFYGGSWDSGQRADYRFAGEAFASQGFVTVVADYRIYPQVRFPGFIEDSAAAFAWTARNIAAYGGDPARLFLAGHSAGAYNAAMLAFNPVYLRAAGTTPALVRGFVGMAGPYDFLPVGSERLRQIFGYPNTSPATQPITFVGSAGAPPSLLQVAGKDTIVAPGNTARLAARLRDTGSRVEVITYPELDHARLVGALAAPLRHRLGPVLEDAARWLRAEAERAPARA